MNLRTAIMGTFLGALAVPASVDIAQSNSMPANGGRSYYASESTCFFQSSWAGISNGASCPGTRSWVNAVPNTFTGISTRNFRADAVTGYAGANPSCTAYIIAQSGSYIWNSGTGIGILGNMSVQGTDTFHFICGLSSTGKPLAGVKVY